MKPQVVRLGMRLWGRVWENGRHDSEDEAGTRQIAAPLIVEGHTVGVLGSSMASVRGGELARVAEIAFVAELGSACLARLLAPRA